MDEKLMTASSPQKVIQWETSQKFFILSYNFDKKLKRCSLAGMLYSRDKHTYVHWATLLTINILYL